MSFSSSLSSGQLERHFFWTPWILRGFPFYYAGLYRIGPDWIDCIYWIDRIGLDLTGFFLTDWNASRIGYIMSGFSIWAALLRITFVSLPVGVCSYGTLQSVTTDMDLQSDYF